MINGYLTDTVISKYLARGLDTLNSKSNYTESLSNEEFRKILDVCENYSKSNKRVYIHLNANPSGVFIDYKFSINSIIITEGESKDNSTVFMLSSVIESPSLTPVLLKIFINKVGITFNLATINML